jgi:hypothetical protein
MRLATLLMLLPGLVLAEQPSPEPPLVVKPEAFQTLVNPQCSHCRDEAKRRADELRADDPILAWTRGYSDGGAIPIRFFLAPYRVISDSYGVFVFDPDAGYARGFAPSYEFRFHGWRNGIMVMKHVDGTLFSCLSGLAFDGPRKGAQLTPIPTLTTTWGKWLEAYPQAVAYHMFDKYKPVDIPDKPAEDSVKSRNKPDRRLKPEELVLGVRVGGKTKAYSLATLKTVDVYPDEIGGEKVFIIHATDPFEAYTAFKPVARQPRKFKGPQPGKDGISPPNPGEALPDGHELPPLTLTGLKMAANSRVIDGDDGNAWDPAGRCVAGKRKGWVLDPTDAVVCKWFAWSAEYPDTEIYSVGHAGHAAPAPAHTKANAKVKEVAGTAEFLRLLPKPFATLKAVDPKARTVTLLLDGENVAKVWPVEPDAEVKVGGWWGRLDQFHPGDRVWAWLRLDRKKNPTSVALLADEATEFDMHASLRSATDRPPKFTVAQIDAKRTDQRAWLRARWIVDGLPGTLTIHHVFSGELEIALDHEAMRWGRSLNVGDTVHLTTDPPVKAVVKAVTPWREQTIVRLVVGELESSELKPGQRLGLMMPPPPESVESSPYPPDIDHPRAKPERIEWFLASTYCTCAVGKDICTGDFYTLASCNPNGCGMPNQRRDELARMIDRGLTDRQIFEELVKEAGPLLLRPHLRP